MNIRQKARGAASQRAKPLALLSPLTVFSTIRLLERCKTIQHAGSAISMAIDRHRPTCYFWHSFWVHWSVPTWNDLLWAIPCGSKSYLLAACGDWYCVRSESKLRRLCLPGAYVNSGGTENCWKWKVAETWLVQASWSLLNFLWPFGLWLTTKKTTELLIHRPTFPYLLGFSFKQFFL